MGNAGVGVFSLDGKQVCGFPDAVRIAGFLSADRTVTEQERAGSGRSFEVHRADCGLEDTWRTPGRTTLGFATCPEAGLVAISWFSQPGGKPAGIDVLRDPGHGVIRQLAGTFGALGEGITFADSCRLICAGQRNDKGFANHATCWDIRTGETAVEARGVTFGGSWPSFDAAGGDLIASTVYQVNCHLGKFWEFIDEAGCGEPYKRLAIWNARDGRELFSLSPPEQLAGWKRGDGSQVTEPSAFTISPSHKFVAEGGSGRVRIFANQ